MVFEECTFEECAWMLDSLADGQPIANSLSLLQREHLERGPITSDVSWMAFGEGYECWIAELRRQHIANNETTSK